MMKNSCDLSSKKCVPCEGGIAPLTSSEAKGLVGQLKGWTLAEKTLEKELRFRDFVQNMAFVDEVAKLAEREGHHPDLFIQYNRLKITLWTHAASGLTENDFILAAKIDEIPHA